MNSYYEGQGVTIYHGDCREILPSLPKVDLVFADPFYVPPGMFDWRLFDEFYWGFNESWLNLLRPLLTPKTHVFISFSSEDMARFEMLLRRLEYSISSRVVWHYRNAGGRCAGKSRFGKTYEFIFHCADDSAVLNFPEKWDDKRFDVWTIAIPQSNFKEGKFHDFQKPLELLERIVSIGSFPQGVILDPFMGSGTTLLAASKLGRKAIGIEIEEKYCEIAAKRMSQEVLNFNPEQIAIEATA